MNFSFSTNKKADATLKNNVKIPYGAPKRLFPKFRWTFILILVCSPFIIFSGKLLLDWMFVTSPGIVWMEKKIINANTAGTVEKIFYINGNIVSPDNVIFRLQDKIPEGRMEQIAVLEAELEAANPETESKISRHVTLSKSNAIQLARESVSFYEQAHNNTKWLMEQGAATKAEMDLAETKLKEAKMALAMLDSSYDATSSINPMRIAQIEKSILSLKKMTDKFFDIKLDEGWKVNSVAVSEGQSYSEGELLAIIMNTKQVHILTYVEPADFKKINIGTVATVKILNTGRKLKAVVEQPPTIATNVPSGISEKIYPVTMRGIQVFLRPLEPLQEKEIIEGLPVEVSW